jgi:nucleotide-binding universal stress UspA family protein
LFPTDFSPASSVALALALALARTYGSTLLLAHTISPEPHRQLITDRLSAPDDRLRENARHKLSNFIRSLGATSFKGLLEPGDLEAVIPTIIHEHDADLVVLGTHGRRGVSKLMLGSDAEGIYRSASCPVLTVGSGVHSSVDWKLNRILCPVDVAEDPEPVLHCALALAEESQAELVGLQATPLVPWQHRAVVQERSRRALESLMPADAQDWCKPEYLVRWEHPVEAIRQTSEQREPDLIVMSVHKARVSALVSHPPWPVASEVCQSGRASGVDSTSLMLQRV